MSFKKAVAGVIKGGYQLAAKDPFMKLTTSFAALLGLLFCSASCDSHSWESTQVLHEGMHKAHGEGHGEKHDEKHADDAHGKAAEGHAEKPAKH